MVTSEEAESREESHEAARTVRGKRVMAWGRMRRTAKRTKCEIRVSPKRPREEPEYFRFLNGREVDFTSKTGGFYEPGSSRDRRD
jgi:hypothetical protein